jgi:acyl carrier protein phosphodiesterase
LNFLAHIYLSGDSPEVRMGNIIGDYVKGNQYSNFPEHLRMGILMHRDIDGFTDSHEIVKRTNHLFTERYHKYSGIVTDILYDHFLANLWNTYSADDFDLYVKGIYHLLKDKWEIIPTEMQVFASRCMENNWIKSYADIDGIGRVLWMMSQRTSLPDESKFAIEVLNAKYSMIENMFKEYFPKLVGFIENKYQVIIRKPVIKSSVSTEASQAGYRRA